MIKPLFLVVFSCVILTACSSEKEEIIETSAEVSSTEETTASVFHTEYDVVDYIERRSWSESESDFPVGYGEWYSCYEKSIDYYNELMMEQDEEPAYKLSKDELMLALDDDDVVEQNGVYHIIPSLFFIYVDENIAPTAGYCFVFRSGSSEPYSVWYDIVNDACYSALPSLQGFSDDSSPLYNPYVEDLRDEIVLDGIDEFDVSTTCAISAAFEDNFDFTWRGLAYAYSKMYSMREDLANNYLNRTGEHKDNLYGSGFVPGFAMRVLLPKEIEPGSVDVEKLLDSISSTTSDFNYIELIFDRDSSSTIRMTSEYELEGR